MIPDNENSVDPTVQTIVEMFPEDFLRNNARVWGTFFEYYQGLKRKYEEKAKTPLEHK